MSIPWTITTTHRSKGPVRLLIKRREIADECASAHCVNVLLSPRSIVRSPRTQRYAPPRGQEKPFDEVVVHGATLKGQVVAIEPKGLRFETIYGEGSIFIPFNRLEAVRTEGSYTLQYGEGEEAIGRLWGIKDLHLLVGNELASVERVPVDEIQSGAFAKEHKPSFAERLRARYPY